MLILTPPIIAIYGGAFDPPTTAHVEVVRTLQDAMDVSTVIAVPSFQPPHKTPVARYGDRVNMCAAAMGSNVIISQAEAVIQGESYAIDVMKTLPGYGERSYALVLGTDEVRTLMNWKSPAELFASVGMIVINRPGSVMTEIEREIEVPLPPVVRKRLLASPPITLDTVGHASSSSDVRQMIGEGNPLWVGLVPKTVEEYVKSRGLYGYREE